MEQRWPMSSIEDLRKLFLNSQTIESQLPIGFPEKDVVWHAVSIDCDKCKSPIPEKYIRGKVTQLIPTVISIDGVSFCEKCLLLHHFQWRFRDDGSMEFTDHDGRWCRTYGEKVGMLERILGYIVGKFTRSGRHENRI